EKWQTSFHLLGLDPAPQMPIYLAALSPSMLRLAGEVADGVMLWLCNPTYVREVVIPEVTAGRKRAEAVRAGVQRYRAAGVTSPCVGATGGADVEATLRAGIS
ncbi:MAG: LLM class flavin-dependent oxidoreductase, partial [Solirubrobacteraceae bacterium]